MITTGRLQMVRSYRQRKGENYDDETLERAIQKVRNKEMSINMAANAFGIPKTTLAARVNFRNGFKSLTRGRPPAFSPGVEKHMAKVLISMERCGFCLTRRELTGLVGHYVTRKNIITHFKNNLPGKDWFMAFTRRHKISLKNFHPSHRIDNPFLIYGFFELLESAIARFNIGANRIYCMTEKLINIDLRAQVVNIYPYAAKEVNNRGELCTVMFTSNAIGEKLPPLVISEETPLWNTWLYKKNPSNRNRINPHIFENYFEKVVFPMVCANNEPGLIIYDGRSTHLDIQVLKRAAKHNLTVIKLPLNTSFLQLLHNDARDTIKSNLETFSILSQSYTGQMSEDELSELITQAWDAVDPKMLCEGLKKGGIWPVDRERFPREKFVDEAALTAWEEYVSNENRIINEPFLIAADMESDLDEDMENNQVEDDEMSNGTDEGMQFEFKPTMEELATFGKEITQPRISSVDVEIQPIKANEPTEQADPLTESTSTDNNPSLTKAIYNLCSEIVSVKKEMFGFRQELVKMNSTMEEFNTRIANIEKKLSS